MRISPPSLQLIAEYRAALISRRAAEVYLIFIRLAFNHFMTYVTQHILPLSTFEDSDWGHYSGKFEMNGERARSAAFCDGGDSH